MSSKRHARWKACGRKVRYLTRSDAARAASYAFRRGAGLIQAYGCHWCHFWHIGHRPDYGTQRDLSGL